MLDTVIQQALNALQLGSYYSLIALGYCLVYGVLLLINFAHGDIFMLGTFETQSVFADGSFQIPLLFFTVAIPIGSAATVDASGIEKAYASYRAEKAAGTLRGFS